MRADFQGKSTCIQFLGRFRRPSTNPVDVSQQILARTARRLQPEDVEIRIFKDMIQP